MANSMQFLLAVFLFFGSLANLHASLIPPPVYKVIYVDSSNADLTPDGLSWDSAFVDLQDALSFANPKDTIWVAKGTYYPTSNTDRSISFDLPDSVVVLGGFEGNEMYVYQRNWELNITILSGNIGDANDSLDNSYHVVRTTHVSERTVLDGFVICNGQANGNGIESYGGGWINNGSGVGMRSNPTIRNCCIEFNYAESAGGGMYNYLLYIGGGETSPVITKCIFDRNIALGSGGGIYFQNDSSKIFPKFNQCIISRNQSLQSSGGGIVLNGGGKPEFNQCIISENQSLQGSGGGFIVTTIQSISNATFTDCKILSNKGQYAGGLSIGGGLGESRQIFVNCEISDNTSTLSGGGIRVRSGNDDHTSKVQFQECIISGNSANYEAGGIDIFSANPKFTNCLISGNYTAQIGGGIYVSSLSSREARPEFTNCTISGNYAKHGGTAMYLSGNTTHPKMTNSIVWNNDGMSGTSIAINSGAALNVTYSLIEGMSPPGDGNFDGTITAFDPLFKEPQTPDTIPTSEGNYRLLRVSPVINKGINDSIPVGITVDLDSSMRIVNGMVDMGAYEAILCSDTIAYKFYVDSSRVSGHNTGLSWDNAFLTLEQALAKACDKDTIWIAKGTYFPSDSMGAVPVNPRNSHFYFDKQLVLLGGFEGNESSVDERDWINNETILSGDIQVHLDSSDNCYNVIRSRNLDSCFLLDGVTITQGNTLGGSTYYGAGWYNDGSGLGGKSNPRIQNCTFVKNIAHGGAGMYNNGEGGEASPIYIHCSFISNSAKSPAGGGGLYNNGYQGKSSPHIISCKFKGNLAVRGGAIFNDAWINGISRPVIINSLFTGNRASHYGGAFYNIGESNGECRPKIINSTIAANRSSVGGAMYNYGENGICDPEISNTIIYGNFPGIQGEYTNPKFSHSIVQGYTTPPAGEGNISDSINPQIVFLPSWELAPTTRGNFRLRACSPLINAGEKDSIPVDIEKDIDLLDRVQQIDVDLGAYESPFVENSGPVIIFVDSSNTNLLQNGTSWQTAYSDFQVGLYTACDKDTIWVKKGTYFPSDSSGISPVNPSNATFKIGKDIIALGGFSGNETSTSQRDWKNQKTVFCGNIGDPGSSLDNIRHILLIDHVDSCMVLDGFTITNGNASTDPIQPNGGGLVNDGTNGISSPVLKNLIFKGNHAISGGAIASFADTGKDRSTYIYCDISGNSADEKGGAVYLSANNGFATPRFINTLFLGNVATEEGGAIYSLSEGGTHSPEYLNCSFSGNNSQSGPTNYATLFHSAPAGGTAAPKFFNTVLWGNSGAIYPGINCLPEFNNSLIQDSLVLTGVNNLSGDEDPIFIQQPTIGGPTCVGDLRVLICSPLNDAGDSTFLEGEISNDLAGQVRIQRSNVDIGVYESYYPASTGPTRIYVDSSNISGEQDGVSWATAFSNPQQAIDIACDKDTIWVAKGTYWPTKDITGNPNPADPRNRTFLIEKNLVILGGFIGSETNVNQRDWALNPTVLSGEIGTASRGDNINGIILMRDLDTCMILDGFTILRGSSSDAGGINNVTVNRHSNPTIRNCSFIHNFGNFGGALRNYANTFDASPLIINCLFFQNEGGQFGQGILNLGATSGQSSPKVINCSFSDNKYSIYGSGITNLGSAHPKVVNSIFWGVIEAYGFTPIHIGNVGGATATVTYSLVEKDFPVGDGNLDGNDPNNNPMFVDQTNGDLRLLEGSNAIDAGLNDSLPAGLLYDLGRMKRTQGASVDMGAYEFNSNPELVCNNIEIELEYGSYYLNTVDSVEILLGSDPDFDTIQFSQEFYSCADLENNPVIVSVIGSTIEGYRDTCYFEVMVLEDPNYCCSVGESSDNNHIKSVNLQSSSDTLLNITGNDNGYGAYGGLVTEVNAGTMIDITLESYTVNPITYKYWHVWIDFNGNGSFSSNELVYLASGSQTTRAFSITIPTELNGIRKMRIAMQLNPGFPDPCDGFPLGEVEDYSLYINGCPEMLLLQDQNLNGIYTASKQIVTKGAVLVTEDTKFMAKEFFLDKEFKVIDGVRFETVKNPCGVLPLPIPDID